MRKLAAAFARHRPPVHVLYAPLFVTVCVIANGLDGRLGFWFWVQVVVAVGSYFHAFRQAKRVKREPRAAASAATDPMMGP